MASADRAARLHASPSRQSLPTDPAAAVTIDPESMVVTTFILVFVGLILLCFFSVFVRRILSDGTPAPHRLPTPIRLLRASSFYPGLDPSAIRALPVMTYTGKAAAAGCVVCLCEFEEKESVKVIPACRHVFHPGCIDAWLVSQGSCPICRCSEMFGERWRGGDVFISVFGGGGDHSGDGGSGGVGEREREEGEGDTDADVVEGKVVGLRRSISLCCRDSGTVVLRRTYSV